VCGKSWLNHLLALALSEGVWWPAPDHLSFFGETCVFVDPDQEVVVMADAFPVVSAPHEAWGILIECEARNMYDITVQ
jgi:hypothetical protein